VIGFAVCAPASTAQTLPEGAGAAIVAARCVSCHEADLITSQRLTRDGWSRELDKMIRWGTTISAADRDVLVPYLAMHFAPRPAAGATTLAEDETASASLYARACLTCHEADLIEQQRLTRTGWTREIEKMMRWGALVPDSEKQPLADYLARRFGLR
jgi:mono/diheme cytochrome c family protein